MLRDTPFYIIQISCSVSLILLSYFWFPTQLSQDKLSDISNATITYITVMILNAVWLVKLLSEFLPGMRPKRELWATMFLRNVTSMFSFSAGFIILGNTYILCNLCDLLLLIVPGISLIAEVFNTNEMLIATRASSSAENWLRPAQLEGRSFWTVLTLYIASFAVIGWAFVVYYIQNNDESRQIFENNHYLEFFIVTFSIILVKFVVFLLGRWFSAPRDYAPLSGTNDTPINILTALNAPFLTQIFDLGMLASISFLFGMLEVISNKYKDREYIIVSVEIALVITVLNIFIGKNKI